MLHQKIALAANTDSNTCEIAFVYSGSV